MSKQLTLDDVRRSYEIIKKDIAHCLDNRKYTKTFSLIDTYAIFSQTINDHFCDKDIEGYLQEIAKGAIGIKQNECNSEDKRIVFYDQIGTTICLGLQYLRALNKLGYTITYIFESPLRRVKPELLKEVKELCSSYYVFEEKSTVELGKRIQDVILKTKAPKLISHFSAEGALGMAVIYSILGMEKYRIVPGDHHYYLGVDGYDHFFEYRQFAIKVAHEERCIPLSKIYKLPYYPIISSFCDFQGFPEETDGKVKILAAGSEYKFHGSNWFFETSEWILKSHENAVIIFLGGKSSQIENFVKEKRLEGRFILAGYRKDFVECMKHVDMFLNSYPMGGGLVGLTAINLEKPVISHYEEVNALQNSIRSFLGAEEIDSPISYEDDEKMKQYVSKLINDTEFRTLEGRRMKSMAQTEEKFIQMLGDYLKGHLSSVDKVTHISCHLKERTDCYVKLQNDFLPTVLFLCLREYGISFIKKFECLRDFAFGRKRIVLGWWFGLVCERILPDGLYNTAKSKLKKLFV